MELYRQRLYNMRYGRNIIIRFRGLNKNCPFIFPFLFSDYYFICFIVVTATEKCNQFVIPNTVYTLCCRTRLYHNILFIIWEEIHKISEFYLRKDFIFFPLLFSNHDCKITFSYNQMVFSSRKQNNIGNFRSLMTVEMKFWTNFLWACGIERYLFYFFWLLLGHVETFLSFLFIFIDFPWLCLPIFYE